MRGIIFVELVSFLDHAGGPLFAERVLEEARLPHGGAYTRVSRYPWEEAIAMVTIASKLTGIPAATLSEDFGSWLFDRFQVLYPEILGRYSVAEDLLRHVNDHIHEEVRLLNPGAVPPRVETHSHGTDLVVEYRSHRPFAHIAYGLVRGCMRHFGDTRTIEWAERDPAGRRASFRIGS